MKRTLEPIWHKKADTARKCLNRLNLTLKHAAALGLDVDLQATMKARALLGKQRHTAKHVPLIPYQEAPAFYQWLCAQPHQSCFVLRFLMLTAARTDEVRFATTDEIEDNVLVIPAKRTKTKREHKIPLTHEALRVILQAHRFEGSTLWSDYISSWARSENGRRLREIQYFGQVFGQTTREWTHI